MSERRIVTYGEIDRAEWSRLVRESETGTWFQSPEAYDFFSSMPKLFTSFCIAVERVNDLTNERTLCAVCVGYVTKEKSTIRQFFTRRAIINGGPCLAEDATNEEVKALMQAVREELKSQAIYVETRNFNDYSKWRGAFEAAGFEYQPHLNFHIDCTDREAMWRRMSETRRRQIRKQPTSTLPIGKTLMDITEKDVRAWYEILSALYRTKVRTPLWPVEFFVEAYRQGIAHYMMVRHEGKIIGGIMTVIKGGTVTGVVYEWFECGLNGKYKEQYPSVMATWAGMQWAHEHGCERYDMMGAGEPEVAYGVRDFKSEFGGTLVEHGRFLCVCMPRLYKIGCVGVKMLRG